MMVWEHARSRAEPGGSHLPAGWAAYDAAEDRWPGKFVGFRRVVDGLVCRIEPGDHDSFVADGFQWRVEPDRSGRDPEARTPWRSRYDDEGHADTVVEAIAAVDRSVAYVTSGRAADDYFSELVVDVTERRRAGGTVAGDTVGSRPQAERPAKQSREEKLEVVQEKLTESVSALVTGEDWKRSLTFAAQFRSRSWRNTMLIAVQHFGAYEKGLVPEPFPTYLAGYRQWLQMGRQVMKGQTGYAILAPVTGRFASATPEDDGSWRRLGRGERPTVWETVRSRMMGTRLATVFDVSQTDGPPLPEPPQPKVLEGQAPEGLWNALADQVTERGFDLRLVNSAEAIGGANGLTDYMLGEVSVRTDMDDAAQVKTIAHELGHLTLGGPDSADASLHRGIQEVEAESFALMIAAAHGMDTSAYTVPYVSTWASRVPGKAPVEVVQETAERVRKSAIATLDKLETVQVGDGSPPAPDERPAVAPSSPSASQLTGTELDVSPRAPRRAGINR